MGFEFGGSALKALEKSAAGAMPAIAKAVIVGTLDAMRIYGFLSAISP